MGKKLIYTYIENLNDVLINQGITFDLEFKIEFDYIESNLKLRKNKVIDIEYFGRNIDSIHLLIGKNGSGKSTFLNLLGMNKSDRFSFNSNQKTCNWFSLYYLKENYFVLEGNNINIINNIILDSEDIINDSYSIVIKQDGDKFKKVEFIQQYKNVENDENTEVDKIVYIYDYLTTNESWYTDSLNFSSFDDSLMYSRIYAKKPLMIDVYNQIIKSKSTDNQEFNAKNVKLIVNKRDYLINQLNHQSFGLNDTALMKMFKKIQLYGDNTKILCTQKNNFKNLTHKNKIEIKRWTHKEKFIIEFFEEIIIFKLLEAGQENYDLKDFDIKIELIDGIKFSGDINDFDNRINYLLKLIKTIYKEKINKKFIHLFDDIKKILIEISDHIFANSHLETLISVLQDEELKNLIEFFDETEQLRSDFPLEIKFSNLSSGELQYIKQFSKIKKSVKIAKNSKNILEKIIILIDEPDSGFHPEWSRKYLSNLISELNSEEMGSLKFQVIITSHSPFIATDLPREYIKCIEVNKDVNGNLLHEIKDAEFGLMSNFYDLIKNDFFMSQPIGEYASLFFKKIISNINLLEKNMNNKKIRHDQSKKEIEKIATEINLIDDSIIKKKLLAYLENSLSKEFVEYGFLEKRKIMVEKELQQINDEIDKKMKREY